MVRINWKYLALEGVVFIILGILALLHPFLMSLSIEIVLGSLLTAAGLVQGFRALKHIKEWDAVPALIGSAFALIAGILLLAYPLSGVLTLALILTAYLFIDGISKIFASFQYRPFQGWGWILFSGIISLILAALIFSGLPTTAIWVIGVYLGVYFLVLGISLSMLSFHVKRVMSPPSP